jgi:hypothetical protein
MVRHVPATTTIEPAETAKFSGTIAVAFSQDIVSVEAGRGSVFKFGEALIAALETSCRRAYEKTISPREGEAECTTVRFTLVNQRFDQSISGFFRPTQRVAHELAVRIDVIAPGSTKPDRWAIAHGSSYEQRTRWFLVYSAEFDAGAISRTVEEVAEQVRELLLLGLAEPSV